MNVHAEVFLLLLTSHNKFIVITPELFTYFYFTLNFPLYKAKEINLL